MDPKRELITLKSIWIPFAPRHLVPQNRRIDSETRQKRRQQMLRDASQKQTDEEEAEKTITV